MTFAALPMKSWLFYRSWSQEWLWMRWGAVLMWPSWTNADCDGGHHRVPPAPFLSFQPVLERIQYLYFIIFWKKEWKLNRNIGSSKLNSPLSFFLFSLLSSFPFPFSFSLFFFCIRAPPAPKICRLLKYHDPKAKKNKNKNTRKDWSLFLS